MKHNVLIPNKKPFGVFINDSKTHFDELDHWENNITTGNSENLTDAPLCGRELANDIYLSGSKVVNVLGLFELSTKWGKREAGESEVWAAKIAIERINRLNIIPGYSMNLLVNDTKVSF
ncbi:hypothetical protein WA026_012410 [Henosepilachna vigintioctopunctata]|uniref:Uncharacterized protein n=1 Tax=Henosepilachna vigintioctopunctata TaxID=420089 RepID=A0AAW1V0J8_9CUCU